MWYETLLPRILNMSITGSIVIGILLVLRPLLKKLPRFFAYSLWAVVLFRLLCPVTLSAEFSLLQLFDLPVTESSSIEYIPNNIVSDSFPKVDFLVEEATDLVNSSLPQGWEQVSSRPLADWMAIGTAVWALGAFLVLAISFYSLLALRRTLGQAKPLGDGIYVAAHLDTPLVMGLIHPRIYLPENLSQEEKSYVLLHEECHIRRGDHIFRLLAFAALCIHWFNPLVWLAFYLSDRDMEMSCDEAAARDMDSDMRCDYSQTLLRLAAGRKVASGYPLCFSEADPKGRIRNILKWKRPSKTRWIVCSCVCLLLFASLMTDPIFAVETTSSFSGRIHLTLPEGYDYALLRDPNFNNDRGNIVIFRESADYAVSEGCISLDFSSSGVPLYMERGSATFYGDVHIYGNIHENFNHLYCRIGEFGTIEIIGHNRNRWTAEELAAFRNILKKLEVSDPVQYQLIDMSQEEYLTTSLNELEGYGFWTDKGYLCVDLSGGAGEATISLYEAYTDALVETFSTADAVRDDHHMFTGLTALKEYYLVVSGCDTGAVTIFN